MKTVALLLLLSIAKAARTELFRHQTDDLTNVTWIDQNGQGFELKGTIFYYTTHIRTKFAVFQGLISGPASIKEGSSLYWYGQLQNFSKCSQDEDGYRTCEYEDDFESFAVQVKLEPDGKEEESQFLSNEIVLSNFWGSHRMDNSKSWVEGKTMAEINASERVSGSRAVWLLAQDKHQTLTVDESAKRFTAKLTVFRQLNDQNNFEMKLD